MGRPRKNREEQPHSIHFIVEWADKRGLKPVDFVNALGVDKGTVSRWFSGKLPAEANLPRIAAFLEVGVDDLFRLPGDDWMQRFEPVSTNPAHEPIFYEEEPKIIGRVRKTILDM